MAEQIKINFGPNILPAKPAEKQLPAIIADYEAIIIAAMQMMVERYNRNSDYQWIDMKFSTITGKDFPDDDPIKGKDAVYGWIQGRALESLATHALWLKHYSKEKSVQSLRSDLEKILGEVLQSVYNAWKNNDGHLFFFMTPQGHPFSLNKNGSKEIFKLDRSSAYNASDMFASKGMYAAAQYLHDDKLKAQAKEYCLEVFKAAIENRFASDQQQFDPKNPIKHRPGRLFQGPFMIQIGTAALLAEYERDIDSVEFGLKLINHILSNHVNLNNRWPNLREYDFVEFVDENYQPYVDNNRILSDPGHALEFIGLTLKFTQIVKKLNLGDKTQRDKIEYIESLLPNILRYNFENGFQTGPGGICKLYDLASRQAYNSDMPWWSLPETIRAALECRHIAKNNADKELCLEVLSKCHNAFVQNFVQPHLNLVASQTRDKNGNVVDVIPATPDVDPGYHTGLSLIDAWNILKTIK